MPFFDVTQCRVEPIERLDKDGSAGRSEAGSLSVADQRRACSAVSGEHTDL
jgi:hypothetical protein